MILPKLFGSTYGVAVKYPYVSNLLTSLGIQKFLPFLLASYVTCIIAMLIINYPHRDNNIGVIDNSGKIEWSLLFFRMLIIIPIPILMIFCYLGIQFSFDLKNNYIQI